MISYCIPVCSEHEELRLLLNQLTSHLQDGDEILIQGDQGNVTQNVISVISPYLKEKFVTYLEYPLNKDFATFKNNLIRNVKNPWVFQIDADELVSETFLENIHWILENNSEIDGFALPRVNIVQGLTEDWVQKWGWIVSKLIVQQHDKSTNSILGIYGIKNGTLKVVNFPDYQSRIFRTDKDIRWEGKVHEKLTSSVPCTINMPLPFHEDGSLVYDYCLFHVKQLDRQIKQNEMYSKINL